MAHCNTIFAQILKLMPRHEFKTPAKHHHSGRSFRTTSRWSQFVMLPLAQLAGRNSLRDIVENISSQAHRLYHLGSSTMSCSNLDRINEGKPYSLYEVLFGTLLKRYQSKVSGHDFKFENGLYSLVALTIDLCLSAFHRTDFRTTKGAIELHVSLNHNGYLPEFLTITEGKTADITVGHSLKFPKGSMIAIDRGYIDYRWFSQLTERGMFFVTRLKSSAITRIVERRPVLTCDQIIEFTAVKAARACPKLRRIGYRDQKTGKHYVFLTNNFKMAAKTVADVNKARWQVELFFKWIKQNLKIKSFTGTSINAVMT